MNWTFMLLKATTALPDVLDEIRTYDRGPGGGYREWDARDRLRPYPGGQRASASAACRLSDIESARDGIATNSLFNANGGGRPRSRERKRRSERSRIETPTVLTLDGIGGAQDVRWWDLGFAR